MIIDLHTHTKPWSDDSILTPAELIRRTKQAGLDGVCLTEHEWFWDKQAVARFSQEHEFLVIPGVEINTEDGHFLVFGVEQYSFGMYRTEVLKKIVDDVGGAIILAHPYRRRLYGDMDVHAAVEQHYQKPIFEMVDAIEVSNGKASPQQNRFSQEIQRRLKLKGVGGSDAHVAADIPSSATFFERKIRNLEDLITEIKAGRFHAVDLRTSPGWLKK